MSWQPTVVTTIDGRDVLSDSPEWRLCCEAVYSLSKPQSKRGEWLDSIERSRGRQGRLALEAEMNRVEPAYLLAMGSKEIRRAYLTQTEQHRGVLACENLEQRIVALWEQRRAASTAA